jgi:hypothetical protein
LGPSAEDSLFLKCYGEEGAGGAVVVRLVFALLYNVSLLIGLLLLVT